MCAAAIANVPTDYDITALAVLRYVASGSNATTTLPTSTDWSDSVNDEATCYDLDSTGATLTPITAIDPPTTLIGSTVLVSTSSPYNWRELHLMPICALDLHRWFHYELGPRIHCPLLLQLCGLDQRMHSSR